MLLGPGRLLGSCLRPGHLIYAVRSSMSMGTGTLLMDGSLLMGAGAPMTGSLWTGNRLLGSRQLTGRGLPMATGKLLDRT